MLFYTLYLPKSLGGVEVCVFTSENKGVVHIHSQEQRERKKMGGEAAVR